MNKVPQKAGQDGLRGTGGRSGLGPRRDVCFPVMGTAEVRQGSESRHVGLSSSVKWAVRGSAGDSEVGGDPRTWSLESVEVSDETVNVSEISLPHCETFCRSTCYLGASGASRTPLVVQDWDLTRRLQWRGRRRGALQ